MVLRDVVWTSISPSSISKWVSLSGTRIGWRRLVTGQLLGTLDLRHRDWLEYRATAMVARRIGEHDRDGAARAAMQSVFWD